MLSGGALATLVAAAVPVALVLPAPSLAAHAAAHPATAVVRVSPVDATGTLKPGYRVAHRYSGARCQRRSGTTGTAYRCFTSQAPVGVLDPCWLAETDAHVVCLDRPWRHRVVRLTVTGGYDDTDAFHPQATPWGVLLASGRHCLYVLGSVHSVDGRPVRYYCTRHIALAGRFDRSQRRWRIRAYRDTTPHAGDATYASKGFARVRTAWFGEPSRQD